MPEPDHRRPPEPSESALAEALRARRPSPERRFAGDLRERLVELDSSARRPVRLRTLVAAYVCSGIVLLLIAALMADPARAAPPDEFMTGFTDPVFEDPAIANLWLDRAVSGEAQLVVLPVNWGAISPRPPAAGTDPSDPANPAYTWGTLDAAVCAATAHGLTVALTIGRGPVWAEGPQAPRSAVPGTWDPNPVAYGAFAKAVARRYSGGFDPGTGTLPRVRYYQAWSEPNLPYHLSPQWIRVRGRWIAESPIIYRGLLNAFYAAVKSVRFSNVVITGGVAPFGDRPGGQRVRPALFIRKLLCLNGWELAPRRCPNPAHFDILADHPYTIGGPFQHAYYRDDVSLPDIWKLTRAVRVAVRTGRALPRGPKRVWVTEFGWSTDPPNPQAVPVAKRAYWLEQAFYVLWRQGVSAIAWYLIVDQRPIPNYLATWQTGLYYRDGRRKRGFEAFRFPFVRERVGRHTAVIWGISPAAGTVDVQVRRGGRWSPFMTFHVREHGIFTRRVFIAHGRPHMRATVAGQTSLTWPPPAARMSAR